VKNSISENFFAAGEKLSALSNSNIADALNQSLNGLLGLSFRAGPGSVVDSQGQRTGTFATLIRTTSRNSYSHSVEIPAEAAACAIDVAETIDLERLRAAYRRISDAKILKKSGVSRREGVDQTTVTLGIIFAMDASVPLETLAEEVERLNGQTSNAQWVDMVVILSKGIINYGVQFPGGGISGDLLPPAEGALSSASPPIYVIILIHPTGKYSFNKMCSYLVAHLGLFCPDAKLPFFKDVLEGTPTTAITLCGYQYNVRGDLLPVPRQFYNDRYIAPLPMQVEDDKGNLLSTVQFLPWQDGGVIILKGKLPLEGLLIFLGVEALRRGGIKRDGVQISNVLPINWINFIQMLQRLQQQSNMVVKNPEPKMVVQKMADEGTSSPFIARVFLGLLRFRDHALSDQSKRVEFDVAHNFVLTELMNARTTAQEITKTLGDHIKKVSERAIVRVHGQSLHIDETIDRQLGKQVEDFINGTARTLKHGMQTLAKAMDTDIGFLFQKADSFAKGIAALEKADAVLAEYLKQVRPWSERLMQCRNDIEHAGWKLSKIAYSNNGGIIRAEEPEVFGQKVTEFAKFILDRVICFVEEVTMHLLQARMPIGSSITEVALSKRDSEIPVRFQVTLSSGGMPTWHIYYHQSPFEET